MIVSLMDVFFGCWHKRYSFPITLRAGSRRLDEHRITGTYIVCLDCGKEFPYDWEGMKVVEPGRTVPVAMAEPVESYAGKQAENAA